MGVLSWLFGESASQHRVDVHSPATHVAEVTGSGAYDCDIVGESHYQDALLRISGGRIAKGHRLKTVATLVQENDNRHDENAVRVEIGGQTVGYLSRADAPLLREALSAAGYAGFDATCRALIVGGWDRGNGDVGHFGVKLDLPIGG